jgi:hypothetical protein
MRHNPIVAAILGVKNHLITLLAKSAAFIVKILIAA